MLSRVKATAHRATERLAASMVARRMATVALLLALSALTIGWATHGGFSGKDPGRAEAAASLGSAQPKAAPALQFGQADFHVDAGGYGISVSITQMSNDCGAAAAGTYCLRYSVETEDEIPLEVGYGLIPASDVTVNGTTVSLSVDTRAVQGMHQVVGAGGRITIVWTSASVSPASTISRETTQMHMASTHGNILGHGIPASGVTAAMVYFAKA